MTILLIILIIIAIPLIAAASMKPEYIVEQEIIINKPRQEVFNYIKFLKNQANYNKWVMMDPESVKEYIGTDGTVGFTYKWDSANKQLGKGEQEIKGIREGERIDYELRFLKPFASTANSAMATTALSANETKVSWSFSGVRNYMMKLMHMLLNLKKMMEKELQTSLGNLKVVLEK